MRCTRAQGYPPHCTPLAVLLPTGPGVPWSVPALPPSPAPVFLLELMPVQSVLARRPLLAFRLVLAWGLLQVSSAPSPRAREPGPSCPPSTLAWPLLVEWLLPEAEPALLFHLYKHLRRSVLLPFLPFRPLLLPAPRSRPPRQQFRWHARQPRARPASRQPTSLRPVCCPRCSLVPRSGMPGGWRASAICYSATPPTTLTQSVVFWLNRLTALVQHPKPASRIPTRTTPQRPPRQHPQSMGRAQGT